MAAPTRTDKLEFRRLAQLGLAVRLVKDCAAGWTVAGAALAVLQGLLPLAGLYLLKLLVDTLTRGLAGGDRTGLWEHALTLIALAAGVAALGVLLRNLAALATEAQAMAVTDHVADQIHRQSTTVDLAYYETPAYYDTLHRAQIEAPYRPLRIVTGLTRLAESGILMVAVAGLLMTFHWAVPLVLLAAAVPGLFVRMHFSRKFHRWQREQTEAERRSWYYHALLTAGDYAKEIRLFGIGPLVAGWYRDVRTGLRGGRFRLTAERSAADCLLQGGSLVVVYAGYALAAYQVIAGRISLGDLVMIYQAFQRGMAAIQDASSALAGLYDDSLFLSNYHEFLELQPRVTAPEAPVTVPRPFREALALDNVSFAYPGSDRRVLDGVSLALRPGEVIALVGENGAGKTTLVKLICRLYDPTAGAVTLDGIDLRRFRPEALRREIGVIFQDFARYALTARENIRLGDHELAPGDPRLEAAVRQAGAEPVIRRLPDGLDTLLGCQFAGGTELSAGQWQRIALARAFLRDSRIVVLDEPTSSLDPVAEHELFATFRRLLEGRAAILISHRFSTVRMADTIHVLAGGRIVESGSHEALMAAGGHYASMFELQSANYR